MEEDVDMAFVSILMLGICDFVTFALLIGMAYKEISFINF